MIKLSDRDSVYDNYYAWIYLHMAKKAHKNVRQKKAPNTDARKAISNGETQIDASVRVDVGWTQISNW
jgi:hypothetical protein